MPYLGGHYWLWLTLTVALMGSVWFVWQFERGGFNAPVPSLVEQDEATRKARALLQQMQQDAGSLKESAQTLAKELSGKAAFVIHDASFFGRSAEGKSWNVEAAEAAQPDGEKLIYLQDLTATVARDGQEEVQLRASSGLLDDSRDLLLLKEGFSGVVHNYQTKGAGASYQLKHQQAKGQVLDVMGQAFRFEAPQFTADLEEEKASFEGGVRLQLSLNKANSRLASGGAE